MISIKTLLATAALVATAVHALDNGVGLKPAMGWSSWNLYACKIDENLIKRMADAMVSTGLINHGYTYINIDDCWQHSSRDALGRIEADPVTFPSGIKALADYIHSKGLKFGIYSSAGSKTCEKLPGSLGYEENDADSYAEWEVDYVKMDNCFTENLVDRAGTIKRYSAMRDALNSTGRPMVFSLCNWGFANSWDDSFTGKWCSAMAILDMVSLAPVLNLYLPSLFLLSILSNDEVIAINQDALGKSAHLMTRKGGIDTWVGELEGGERVVLVLNRGAEVAEVEVDLELLGATEGQEVKFRDLWKKEDVGAFKGKLVVKEALAKHASVMYRVRILQTSSIFLSEHLIFPIIMSVPFSMVLKQSNLL
ncbi:glycoside hydrolase superfamily [Chytridium lagenaria]|nr:glycoside hydrolase superfamily [Chytridium lagenaria]